MYNHRNQAVIAYSCECILKITASFAIIIHSKRKSGNRMWKLLVDKKMSKADLRKAADIAPNTMTKLRRDEPVNLAILGRICDVLNCDYGDLMQYVPEENTNDQ